MTRTRKRLALICAVVVAIVSGVMTAFPPYRSYTPDAIVHSVIAEAIIPAFPADARPDVEWEDGARRLWQSHPAEVRFYGIEEAVVQNRILESVRQHLAKSNLSSIAVCFFPKGRTSTHRVEEIRYLLIQK